MNMNIPKLSDRFGGKIPGMPQRQETIIPNVENMSPARGSIPGVNTPINMAGSAKNMDDKIMGNINFRTDKIGWGRIGQQKGLKPFGDKDGDKLKNIFDCDPYNRKKQGYIHKVVNLVKGKGFRENVQTIPVGEVTYEAVPPNRPIETLQQESTVVQPIQAQPIQQTQQPVWKELLYGTGVLKTKEQQMLAQQVKKEQELAKIQAQAEIEKERLKKIEAQKNKAKSTISEARTQLGGSIQDVERGIGAFRQGYAQAQYPQSNLPSSRYAAMLGAGAPKEPYDDKARRLFGLKTKSKTLPSNMGQPLTQQMQYSQQAIHGQLPAQQYGQPQYGQTQPSAQPLGPPPEPGMTWSEKSKRWVKYERRPYRRRIPATYQQGY